MWSQRLKLGTFFGVDLYVHWTFALLVAYVIYVTWISGADGPMIAFTVAQLFTVFTCVTLHEYGHALAARRYDVDTHDITLLPIGGVARLKSIPRIPRQELVIAVAGPAVNVVIASLLSVIVLLSGGGWIFETIYQFFVGDISPENRASSAAILGQILDGPTLIAFVITMLLINVVLVLFNLIPAFPMDGGRVLRSMLAMAMPYSKATRWAQRVGVFCAILMAIFAIISEPPRFVMLLIAGFIAYAGFNEVKQVEAWDLFSGLRVGDVMSKNAPVVRADMTIEDLAAWWKTNPGRSAAVIGINGILLGQLRLGDLVNGLKRQAEIGAEEITLPDQRPAQSVSDDAPLDVTLGERPRWGITAIDLADPTAETLEVEQRLDGLGGIGRQNQTEFPVIDANGRLVGWIDLASLRDRAAMARILPTSSPASGWTLDQRV